MRAGAILKHTRRRLFVLGVSLVVFQDEYS